MNVLLVKLGGSLITDKRKVRRARTAVIRRLAKELSGAGQRTRILVGHGSGSFGHAAATACGLDGTRSIRDREATSVVQASAHDLHGQVMDGLRGASVHALSLPPSAWARGQDGRITGGSIHGVETALRAGLVPVVSGDVLLNSDGAATICSTERVLLWCARRLISRGHQVRRALWLGITDGVYDEAGDPVSKLTTQEWATLRETVGGPGAADVTGGMHLRIETALDMARMGIESWVIDGTKPGHLSQALRGQRTGGTRVPPAPRRSKA